MLILTYICKCFLRGLYPEGNEIYSGPTVSDYLNLQLTEICLEKVRGQTAMTLEIKAR